MRLCVFEHLKSDAYTCQLNLYSTISEDNKIKRKFYLKYFADFYFLLVLIKKVSWFH